MAESLSVSYAPSEELELIRSTARQFLAERLPMARVRELMMSAQGFEPGLWKEMADLGWTGLSIPEENGGAGFGLVEMGVLLEEMGRVTTPGPFFASAVLATNLVQALGTPEQRAEMLPSLASGESIGTVAIFEGARQWAPEAPATTATRSEDGWTIVGEKRSVLAGETASFFLVTAQTVDGVGVFVVEPDASGVEVTPEPVLDLTRRQALVSFDSVDVPQDALLGVGDAVSALDRTLLLASAALACEQVGGAQACMEMSVEYAKSRYQFGRPIGSYQAIKHRCANMLMKVEHARSAAYYAVRVSHDDDELAVAAPLAASMASDAYVWVTGENIQVHGGIGFTWEHDSHVYLKRAKASSLLLGDPRRQRDLMGKALGL